MTARFCFSFVRSFQNSKFLKFVTQLNSGELKIEGNDIVKTSFAESAEMFDKVLWESSCA